MDATPELVTFTHEQSALQLPAGEYVGTVQATPYLLGANGMDRTWRRVTIVHAPDSAKELLDTTINIW